MNIETRQHTLENDMLAQIPSAIQQEILFLIFDQFQRKFVMSSKMHMGQFHSHLKLWQSGLKDFGQDIFPKKRGTA